MVLERIQVTAQVERDLEHLPERVEETYFSKVTDADTTLQMGAEPRQVFKGLTGDIHPLLQMPLGGDYRAWFIEGRHLHRLEDGWVHGLRVLRKKEAKILIVRIEDALAYAQSVLG